MKFSPTSKPYFTTCPINITLLSLKAAIYFVKLVLYGDVYCVCMRPILCVLKSPGRHQRTCKVKVIVVIPSFTRFHKTKHFICKRIFTFSAIFHVYWLMLWGRVGDRETVDKRLFSRKPSGSSKLGITFNKTNIWKQFFFLLANPKYAVPWS